MLLDELIVKLGLDSSDIEKAGSATKKLGDIEKAGKGAEEGVAGIGEASKGTSYELGGLIGKMTGFLALIGGTYAIKSFITDTIETNTQLHFLAENLNMNAQALSAWGIVAQEFGGTSAGLQGTLKRLSMEATNFALTGHAGTMNIMSMLGVGYDPDHPEKEMANIEAAIQKRLANGVSRPKLYNLMEMMGFDEGTINATLEGSKKLRESIAEAKKVAITGKEASDMAALNKQLVLMDAHLAKVGTDLLDKASPALGHFFDLVNKFGTWVQNHESLAEWIGGIAIAMGGLTVAAAGLAALSGPLGLVAAAVIAIGASVSMSKEFSQRGPDKFRKMAEDAATKYGVNPNLIKAIMGVESSWNPNAVSPKGAMGLMQLMPGTAKDLGVTNPFDPAQNIDAGTRYFKKLLDKYGDPRMALAAYNSGNPNGNSKETQEYIAKVMKLRNDIFPHGHLASPIHLPPNMAPPIIPNQTTNNRNNHVGELHIHTQSTDAKGIAASFARGTDWLFASQANGAQV